MLKVNFKITGEAIHMRTYNTIFDVMQEEMERMFADEFSTFTPIHIPNRILLGKNPTNEISTHKNSAFRRPVTDIVEHKSEYVATIELPGVEKKDIAINIHEDSMEIKVEKEAENETKDEEGNMTSYSKQYAGFYRCFRLPENTNTDAISADYKNGMLTLTIPKKEIEAKKEVKRIEVK
jgi:HSP20 family protein